MTEKRLRVKTKQRETSIEETQYEKLERLMATKVLSDVEMRELVDIGAETDAEAKIIEKENKAIKERLKSHAIKENLTSGIEGNVYQFQILPKNTTEVVKTPTEFIRFLKTIGKLDVIDAVLSVPLTNLKKFVDINTLEREGILKTTANPFGITKYKRR